MENINKLINHRMSFVEARLGNFLKQREWSDEEKNRLLKGVKKAYINFDEFLDDKIKEFSEAVFNWHQLKTILSTGNASTKEVVDICGKTIIPTYNAHKRQLNEFEEELEKIRNGTSKMGMMSFSEDGGENMSYQEMQIEYSMFRDKEQEEVTLIVSCIKEINELFNAEIIL